MEDGMEDFWYGMEDFRYGMELYGRFCLLWKMEDLHSIVCPGAKGTRHLIRFARNGSIQRFPHS